MVRISSVSIEPYPNSRAAPVHSSADQLRIVDFIALSYHPLAMNHDRSLVAFLRQPSALLKAAVVLALTLFLLHGWPLGADCLGFRWPHAHWHVCAGRVP